MKFSTVAPLALSSVALAATSTSIAVVSDESTTLITITSCGPETCYPSVITSTLSTAVTTSVVTVTGSDEVVTATTHVSKSTSLAGESSVVTPASAGKSASSEGITYVDVTTTPTVTKSVKASTDVTITPTLYTTYNSNATIATVQQFEGAGNKLSLGVAGVAVAGLLLL